MNIYIYKYSILPLYCLYFPSALHLCLLERRMLAAK